MQVVHDRFGNDVNLGDILLHIVRRSTSITIRYVIVYGVRINRYGDVILNVYSAKSRNKTHVVYKTHVRVDTGIVKINNDVPVHIKKLLYAHIGKNIEHL